MAKRPRRNHASAFEAKVALQAVKEEKAASEIVEVTGVHPHLVAQWKKRLLARAAEAFEKERPTEEGPSVRELNAKIGQLVMENDFLAGALGRPHETSAKRRSRPHVPCLSPGGATRSSSQGPPSTTGPSR
ncbi:MAG: transposase [Actinomycetota bacterium]